jgi:hypothetical protein
MLLMCLLSIRLPYWRLLSNKHHTTCLLVAGSQIEKRKLKRRRSGRVHMYGWGLKYQQCIYHYSEFIFGKSTEYSERP